MRRFFSALAFGLLFVLPVAAQKPPPSNFGPEAEKLPKVNVKAEDYDHFRTVVAYEVLPKYKYGDITTMANGDQSEIGVYRHKSGKFNPDDMLKDGAMVLIMSAARKKDGSYDVHIKLENGAKSGKLAKDIERAFKKKRKR